MRVWAEPGDTLTAAQADAIDKQMWRSITNGTGALPFRVALAEVAARPLSTVVVLAALNDATGEVVLFSWDSPVNRLNVSALALIPTPSATATASATPTPTNSFGYEDLGQRRRQLGASPQLMPSVMALGSPRSSGGRLLQGIVVGGGGGLSRASDACQVNPTLDGVTAAISSSGALSVDGGTYTPSTRRTPVPPTQCANSSNIDGIAFSALDQVAVMEEAAAVARAVQGAAATGDAEALLWNSMALSPEVEGAGINPWLLSINVLDPLLAVVTRALPFGDMPSGGDGSFGLIAGSGSGTPIGANTSAIAGIVVALVVAAVVVGVAMNFAVRRRAQLRRVATDGKLAPYTPSIPAIDEDTGVALGGDAALVATADSASQGSAVAAESARHEAVPAAAAASEPAVVVVAPPPVATSRLSRPATLSRSLSDGQLEMVHGRAGDAAIRRTRSRSRVRPLPAAAAADGGDEAEVPPQRPSQAWGESETQVGTVAAVGPATRLPPVNEAGDDGAAPADALAGGQGRRHLSLHAIVEQPLMGGVGVGGIDGCRASAAAAASPAAPLGADGGTGTSSEVVATETANATMASLDGDGERTAVIAPAVTARAMPVIPSLKSILEKTSIGKRVGGKKKAPVAGGGGGGDSGSVSPVRASGQVSGAGARSDVLQRPSAVHSSVASADGLTHTLSEVPMARKESFFSTADAATSSASAGASGAGGEAPAAPLAGECAAAAASPGASLGAASPASPSLQRATTFRRVRLPPLVSLATTSPRLGGIIRAAALGGHARSAAAVLTLATPAPAPVPAPMSVAAVSVDGASGDGDGGIAAAYALPGAVTVEGAM